MVLLQLRVTVHLLLRKREMDCVHRGTRLVENASEVTHNEALRCKLVLRGAVH